MKSHKQILIVVVSVVVGWLLGKAVGGSVFFLIVGLFLFGLWFGNWFISKFKQNKLVSCIVWSNVFAGVIAPPLGVLIASITYSFSQKVAAKDKTKYKRLWILGVVVSAINAVVGIYLLSLNG